MGQDDVEQDINEVCYRWRDEIRHDTSALKELTTCGKEKQANDLTISCLNKPWLRDVYKLCGSL